MTITGMNSRKGVKVKRYRQQPLETTDFQLVDGELFEHPDGKWIKYTDHNEERKELYETIDRNSRKIIKLTEQNREMLELMKERVCQINDWKNITTKQISDNFLKTENLIEKAEGEQNDMS